ncbi:MAG: asparagine synthase (glutamine-hydrolyzing) [Sandaracinaceae bacterium]|nr:asparagine synthase (glutamine-hydrolyzing) [Sandaracinaceae bacterium]
MCGLVGVVEAGRDDAPITRDRLVAMRDSLIHRGPDDAGEYLGAGVALGSRRLAILDLSERGHMPMATPDGRYWIAYNGEVYNCREGRDALIAKGVSFRSECDTEVVLHAVVTWGVNALSRFNGMFAFALWDSQDKTLLLGRDRLGVKPLYYVQHQSKLFFASEHKALFVGGAPKEFDANTWEELLLFRFTAGERTPWKGVERLLPGHVLRWQNGRVTTERWWSLAERATSLRDSAPRDAVSWYRQTFEDSVRLRTISDVPLGVMLSGGLDSSTVAGTLATQSSSPVASFTVRFTEAELDEGPVAQSVVDKFHLEQHEIRVTPEDLHRELRRASYLFDEPLVHGNDVHVLKLADYAKSRVTVLLSGEGADETLNGYIRYQPLRFPFLLNAGRSILPHLRIFERGRLEVRARKLRKFLEMGQMSDFVLYNACDVLPVDLQKVGLRPSGDFGYRRKKLAEAAAVYPNEWLRQAMFNDQHTFLSSLLDRNDRMTMGASIECRVPFLDYRLIEQLAALPTKQLFPTRQRKAVLREAFADRLPKAVQKAPKKGFGVPWRSYLLRNPEFRDEVSRLSTMEPITNSPLDPARVKKTADEFLAGDYSNESLVRMMLSVCTWHEAAVRNGAV